MGKIIDRVRERAYRNRFVGNRVSHTPEYGVKYIASEVVASTQQPPSKEPPPLERYTAKEFRFRNWLWILFARNVTPHVAWAFMFRVFGYGLHFKPAKGHVPLFSERNGLRKCIYLGPLRVELLTP